MISLGVSVPFIPTSLARTKMQGLATSTIDASIAPLLVSITSTTFPVGSSLPVAAPAVEAKSIRMGALVPGTPSILQFPETTAFPSRTSTSARRILPVLVLWMRTMVTPSSARTMLSSMAKGPTPEEILPQLPL